MGRDARWLRHAVSQTAPQELNMVIRIIKTKAQHRAALDEAVRLARLDPAPESSDGLRLELLAKLIEDYEKARFVFAKPDPIDAILFRMEERGLRQTDLAKVLGGKNRASEVLARKRPLTLPMIRALHEKLDIPPALLIREPAGVYRVRRVVSKSMRAARRTTK
jgi:HTH-type transcriptional regulator/antitoxin HigA